MLMFIIAASLAIATASLLFYCSESSLLCDTEICDINVEMLCWYDNVSLVRIDNYDNLMNNVHIGTPVEAYT